MNGRAYRDPERKRTGDAAAGCLGVLVVVAVVAIVLTAANAPPSHSVAAAGTVLPKASATVTPSPSATPTPSPSATATPSLTATPTTASPETKIQPPSASRTPTSTPSPSMTPTPSSTPTPLPTPDRIDRVFQVPILMYHYVSDPPDDADDYRLNLSTRPRDFEAHLSFLRSEGYVSIDLYHLLDALTWDRPLPDHPIIITFDDGYRDNYENAFPLLLAYGFSATFFILTEPIDNQAEPYLTWPEVEEMAAAGMDIEPHTKNHFDLRGRGQDFLVWEILGSAQTIQAHLGRYPRFLAYPFGWYDGDVIAFLQGVNFWGAVTTWSGTFHSWEGRFELERVRVSGGDDEAVLEGKLVLEPAPTPDTP